MKDVTGLCEAAHQALKMLDAGVLRAKHVGPSWSQQYCGNVTFKTDNGWTFVVFNDCDEWDYIDSFTSPGGQTVTLEDMPRYDHYTPETKWYELTGIS